MEKLRIYRIEDKYIRFLKSRDSRVPDNTHLPNNKGNRRPYVGIVLLIGSYRYFVPMESPKPNHANLKSGVHIMKLDGGKLGLLGFNNMIPVPESALIQFDIDNESDKKYADLLRHQATCINRNKAEIFDRASKTYYRSVNGENKFFSSICCNFRKLEKACKQYDPQH